MIKNGRQTAPTLDGIRDDHKARYRFAIKKALHRESSSVVDVGTGTGYGAYMMAEAGLDVTAYEIDAAAIAYGEKHYSHPNLRRVEADIETLILDQVDLLTMFEIIEHSEQAPAFLERASHAAKMLIGSVPNEEVIPFTESLHRQHVRHYTPDQLRDMLEAHGWEVLSMGCQTGKRGVDARVTFSTTHGRTIVFTAQSKVAK